MDTHSWLGVGTSTSMKRGKVKLVLWPQTSLLSEMIGSYKSFLRVRKHSVLHYSPTLWYRAFDDDDIVYSRHSQKWWVLCSFAYLRWRRRDVCNFHMIYIDDIIHNCMCVIFWTWKWYIESSWIKWNKN